MIRLYRHDDNIRNIYTGRYRHKLRYTHDIITLCIVRRIYTHRYVYMYYNLFVCTPSPRGGGRSVTRDTSICCVIIIIIIITYTLITEDGHLPRLARPKCVLSITAEIQCTHTIKWYKFYNIPM